MSSEMQACCQAQKPVSDRHLPEPGRRTGGLKSIVRRGRACQVWASLYDIQMMHDDPWVRNIMNCVRTLC